MHKPLTVPLSEPERLFDLSEGKISHDLSLPVGTDDEQIILYPGRLLSLARSAGAQSLHLSFDRSALPPDNVDVEDIGGGIAALKGLKKAEYQGVFEYNDRSNPSLRTRNPSERSGAITDLCAYRADKLTIELGASAIKQNINADKRNKRGPLDENLWAKYLDQAVRKTLIEAASYRFSGENTTAKEGGNTRAQAIAMDMIMPFFPVAMFATMDVSISLEVILPLVSAIYYGVSPLMINVADRLQGLDSVHGFFYMSRIDKVLRTFARTKAMPSLVAYKGTN